MGNFISCFTWNIDGWGLSSELRGESLMLSRLLLLLQLPGVRVSPKYQGT